jgi:hypothetical protein
MLYRNEGNLNTSGKSLKNNDFYFQRVRELHEFAKFSRRTVEFYGKNLMAGLFEAELVDGKRPDF